MVLQGAQGIEILTAHDPLDLVQGQLHLAVEQDLLQLQNGCLTVIAVTVSANPGRLEQPDLVIVVQGARCDPRHLSDLFDCEHARSINYDVTLMSRGNFWVSIPRRC